MATARASLAARRFINELKSCGITHAVWLPDSEANFLYEAMIADADLQVVPVCREGESFAIALGLNRWQDSCRFDPKHRPLDLADPAAPAPRCEEGPYVAETFPVSVDKRYVVVTIDT